MKELRDNNSSKHEVAGLYTGQGSAGGYQARRYEDGRALIGASDMLFVGQSAGPVFDLCKAAVRDARHVYLESPMMLEADELSRLYELARESYSIIKWNQQLIHHPLYRSIRGQMDAVMAVVRIDSARQYRSHQAMGELLYEAAGLIRSTVRSGLRKMISHIVPSPDSLNLPAAYQVRLDFDNGNAALILVNHLTSDESFRMEFLGSNVRHELDLNSGEGMRYDPGKRKNIRFTKPIARGQELAGIDLAGFLEALDQPRPPLIINEEGETVHEMVRSMQQQLENKMQLFA
jgi:predicted dehydrogenase